MNRKSKKVTQMMRSLSPEPMGISMASINPQRRPLTYLSYNQNKLPIAFNITRTENIYNRNRKKEFTVSQCDQLSSISKKFNPAIVLYFKLSLFLGIISKILNSYLKCWEIPSPILGMWFLTDLFIDQ